MKKILEYFVALLLILGCNSVYFVLEFQDYHLNVLCSIISCLVLFFQVVSTKINKKKLLKSLIFLFFYYIYIILFLMLNYLNNLSSFVNLFVVLFPVLYMYYIMSYNNKNILYKIKDIMCALAITSLFFYIFGSILNIIKSSGYVWTNWSNIKAFPSFYGLHFNTQHITIFGLNIWRNTGLFPEGPMFSLNLTIALAIELFLSEKKSKTKILILVSTIFTTLSTIGIAISSFMIIISILRSKYNNKIKKIIKYLTFPIIIVLLIGTSLYFFNARKQNDSYSIRLDDYRASYLAWKENPIIGTGYGNTDAIKNHMSSHRSYNQGLSNSLMVLLAECGVYLFIFYLIPFIKAMRYGIRNKKYNIVIFTIVILFLLITTTFQFRTMIINLLAMGYALPNKKEGKDLNEKI